MRLAHIAVEIAQKRIVRLLVRRMPEAEALAFVEAWEALVDAKIWELRRVLEAERDETRRRFYEVHPTLHPERMQPPRNDAA